jgi:Skp family chaperone for outer membrane proteins
MKRFWMPALGVVALSAAILATRPAITAPAKGQGDTTISVGYVDVQKVLQDSPAAVNARKEAEALKTRLQEKLAQQQEFIFLTSAELQELGALQDKAQAQTTDKEKARIAELQKKSQSAETELRTLQQKGTPSDTEKARMQELTTLRTQNMNRLQMAQQQAQEELDKKAGDLMDGLQNRILKAVEEVATDEKLPMVVDKQARLYGGRDITESVINKLKK